MKFFDSYGDGLNPKDSGCWFYATRLSKSDSNHIVTATLVIREVIAGIWVCITTGSPQFSLRLPHTLHQQLMAGLKSACF